MSDHVENGSRFVEMAMGLVTSATVFGVLHWVLGVPAALYYVLKFWRLLKKRHKPHE